MVLWFLSSPMWEFQRDHWLRSLCLLNSIRPTNSSLRNCTKMCPLPHPAVVDTRQPCSLHGGAASSQELALSTALSLPCQIWDEWWLCPHYILNFSGYRWCWASLLIHCNYLDFSLSEFLSFPHFSEGLGMVLAVMFGHLIRISYPGELIPSLCWMSQTSFSNLSPSR